MAAKIKKGDRVIVLTGKEKKLIAEVLSVNPKKQRVLVAGVHKIKRHTKPSQNNEGGIIEKESSIHISNVALVDKNNKATRVGFKFEDNKKVRFAHSTKEVIK